MQSGISLPFRLFLLSTFRFESARFAIMWRLWISFAVAASLTACSSDPVSPGPRSSNLTPASFHTGGLPPPTQCVLFARDFTGVHLRGDAYAWWDAAEGIYPRR